MSAPKAARYHWALAFGLWMLLGSPTAFSQEETAAGYTDKGADACLRCHDEDSEFPVLALFRTRHGHRGDERSPFAQLQCESCHGPGEAHSARVRRGRERPPMPLHGPQAPASAEQNNAVCLGCHADGHTADWANSIHNENDVACTSCHRIHAERDDMQVARLQNQTCYSCHPRQRSDAHKASVHPLRYGDMACSDCHQPHASANEFSLVRSTINETCITCHAEKRGPFLWEHAPVEEDCSLCHRSHGSNHPTLLTRRSPLLCQQCHSRSGHPSLALTSEDLPGGNSTLSAFLVSRGCGNCHAQVHGSNHPSGVNLTR